MIFEGESLDDITRKWAFGHIKMINREKGFGFITPENGGDDVHFSINVTTTITWNDLGSVKTGLEHWESSRRQMPELVRGNRVAYLMKEHVRRATCAAVTPAELLEEARRARAAYATESERKSALLPPVNLSTPWTPEQREAHRKAHEALGDYGFIWDRYED